jgi:geranylgeranyl pyrophosphate synthase
VKTQKALSAAVANGFDNPAGSVEGDLRIAEAKLLGLLDSREGLIAEICHYLIDGRGKRLRPLFVLLVYRAAGGKDANARDAIDVAIALELIHSATLLHDDIIDAGALRRGKPSAFKRFGLGPTLVAGDYLFSRAFQLCGRFDEKLVNIASGACIELTEGEVMEGRFHHNAAVSLEDYIAVIDRKTASLFSAGGKVASELAGTKPPVVTAMANLGIAIGRAFQMIDDLLDVTGPEQKIGKPVGSDLRAGIPSLPVVIGVERDPELKRLFQHVIRADGPEFIKALDILRSPRILKEARALAAAQIERARTILEQLPPSIYRDSLAMVIDDQVDREV